MRFATILSLALPLLVAADSSTTTYTSTQTQTKTITISEIVANVTSTYSIPHNTSSTVGTTSYYTSLPFTATSVPTITGGSGPSPTKLPADVAGAASSISAMYAGSAGMLIMIAAALL